MFSRLINKVLGPTEKPKPEPTTADVTNAVDAHFDSMQVDSMSIKDARWVEDQRRAAHAELARQTLASALDGWQRPGRMG